jgi:hypothetical protein
MAALGPQTFAEQVAAELADTQGPEVPVAVLQQVLLARAAAAAAEPAPVDMRVVAAVVAVA